MSGLNFGSQSALTAVYWLTQTADGQRCNETTVPDLLIKSGAPTGLQAQEAGRSVAAALRAIGWSVQRVDSAGNRKFVWRRPESPRAALHRVDIEHALDLFRKTVHLNALGKRTGEQVKAARATVLEAAGVVPLSATALPAAAASSSCRREASTASNPSAGPAGPNSDEAAVSAHSPASRPTAPP